jgi:hypothetical protein
MNTVPSARNMSDAEFALHLEEYHPVIAGRSRVSHTAQHSSRNGYYRAHVHAAVIVLEVVALPAAREMAQWRFLKHVRLRHPALRYATYDAHQIDHSNTHNRFDHVHGKDTWATVPRHEALQEAVNFQPPILPLARDMEPGAFVRHARDQHGRTFATFLEHDRGHLETPDQLDHRHKDEP